MKLNPGDQVKFLNAVGGGVVTKILNSKMVLVADRDGFEIPTLIAELVKIDPDNAGARFFKEEFRTPSGMKREESDEKEQGSSGEDNAEPDSLDPVVIRNRKSEDIYFAFVPHEQKWLITGLMDIFLINNTSFDIIYNLFHHNEQGFYTGVDYGSLFAGTRHVLSTVNRESLARWTEGSIQFLFHKEKSDTVIPPFNSDFLIDGTKFHKEGAYRDSPLLNEKGIIVRLVSLTLYLKELHPDPAEMPEPGSARETRTRKESRNIIFSHQTEPRKAVIDLHIHELIEDPSNLQKSEILAFQTDYFIRSLEGALSNNFRNVIFIHGVGDGILRQVLTDQLKKTEGIEWFDAPMALYGVGAIEVRIPHNQ